MSTSCALCCVPLVKKQKHDFNIFSVQCIIKQLLDSVFVISRIIEVSVRVISLSLRLRLITPTLSSIILDITKTSSNNCLLSIWEPPFGIPITILRSFSTLGLISYTLHSSGYFLTSKHLIIDLSYQWEPPSSDLGF